MRELNECKAEIFRLGEIKLRERRRMRRRAVYTCVPVCVFAVALTFLVSPTLKTRSAGAESSTQPPTDAVIDTDADALLPTDSEKDTDGNTSLPGGANTVDSSLYSIAAGIYVQKMSNPKSATLSSEEEEFLIETVKNAFDSDTVTYYSGGFLDPSGYKISFAVNGLIGSYTLDGNVLYSGPGKCATLDDETAGRMNDILRRIYESDDD